MSTGRSRPAIGALAGSVAGVALAIAVAALVDEARGRVVLGDAFATMPLAAVLGGLAGARSRSSGRGGLAAGAIGAAGGAAGGLVMASVLATIRFHHMGADGGMPVTAMPSSREQLMLVGVLPAAVYLAAVTTRRLADRPLVALGAAVAIGALASLLSGPMLIVSSGLGRITMLGPVVVTLLVIVGAGVVGRARRSSRSS